MYVFFSLFFSPFTIAGSSTTATPAAGSSSSSNVPSLANRRVRFRTRSTSADNNSSSNYHDEMLLLEQQQHVTHTCGRSNSFRRQQQQQQINRRHSGSYFDHEGSRSRSRQHRTNATTANHWRFHQQNSDLPKEEILYREWAERFLKHYRLTSGPSSVGQGSLPDRKPVRPHPYHADRQALLSLFNASPPVSPQGSYDASESDITSSSVEQQQQIRHLWNLQERKRQEPGATSNAMRNC